MLSAGLELSGIPLATVLSQACCRGASHRCGQVLQVPKQFARGDLKAVRKLDDRRYAQIPHAALGPTNLHRRHAAAFGERLLGQLQAAAVGSDVLTDDDLGLHVLNLSLYSQ